MPASQLHLLIISAVTSQLEQSRSLAEVHWHLQRCCLGPIACLLHTVEGRTSN